MAKVKNYYMNEAEKSADVIINDYVKGNIDFNTAKTKVLKVDNVNLIDIDENNVDDALFYAKEDYWKKAFKDFQAKFSQPKKANYLWIPYKS